MLFLNKSVIQNIGQDIFQNSIEKAYRIMSSKEYHMPDRIHISDKNNSVLFMPCFHDQYFSTKLVSVFPDAMKYDQPVVNGIMVLTDNMSGKPLAIMDGAAITAQRTGGVGGLAVKLLSSQKCQSAAIFGAGIQGLNQARYVLFNRKIETLYIYDLHPAMAENMVQKLQKEFPDVQYILSQTPEESVARSEIIVAATTSSSPLFDVQEKLIQGKTFISIGSYRPDMQEFPDMVFNLSDHVYVDTFFALQESGDMVNPLKKSPEHKNKIKEFSSLFENSTDMDHQTVFFKSVGMGLFDLVVSSEIYQLALKDNLGQIVDF